jgi:Tol biopolymer transport system component
VFGPIGHFGVTRAGDLVYVPGSVGGIGQFVAVRPGGATRVLPIPAKEHLNFSVAPDGRRLAVTSRGVSGQELWIYDMESGQGDRVTSGFAVGYVAWAPDGTLAYAFERVAGELTQTMLLPPDGGSTVALSGIRLEPSAFATRRFLLGTAGLDVSIVELDGTRLVRVDTLQLPNAQYYPLVSPDGRWIAFAGSEKGIAQSFVTPFPAMNRQYKVSADAASEPVWLSDGSLVHRTGACWYRLAAKPGATPPLGAPVLAFCDEKLLNTSGLSNVAMPDGSLLYLRTVAPTTGGFIRVVRGWQPTLDGASGSGAAPR